MSKIDISKEACATVCMIVSNPQGVMRQEGDGWQRRVNDLIRSLRERVDLLEGAAATVIDLFVWQEMEETGEVVPHLDRQFPHLNDALTSLRDVVHRPQGEPAPSPAPASTAHGVAYEVDTGGVIPSARPQDGG